MADNYTVLSQTQEPDINPAGTGFVQTWHITYKVTSGPAKGTIGQVSVPEDEHDAATVKSMIEAKISTLGQVASLGNS